MRTPKYGTHNFGNPQMGFQGFSGLVVEDPVFDVGSREVGFNRFRV